jgi:hypothetical protein
MNRRPGELRRKTDFVVAKPFPETLCISVRTGHVRRCEVPRTIKEAQDPKTQSQT